MRTISKFGPNFCALNSYLIKIKHILPSFIISTILSILVLVILRLCINTLGLSQYIKEDLWTSWIAIVAPFFPVVFHLKTRYKILDFKTGYRARDFFLAICWATMTLMIISSQNFFTYYNVQFQKINQVHEIESFKNSNFFELKNIMVDTTRTMVYYESNSGTKSSDIVSFTMYVTSPILVRKKSGNLYYYADTYQEQYSNPMSETILIGKFNAFKNYSLSWFKAYNYDKISYFEVIPYSNAKDKFLHTQDIQPTDSISKSLVFIKPIKDLKQINSRKHLNQFLVFFALGTSVLLFALLFPVLKKSDKKDEYQPNF